MNSKLTVQAVRQVRGTPKVKTSVKAGHIGGVKY